MALRQRRRIAQDGRRRREVRDPLPLSKELPPTDTEDIFGARHGGVVIDPPDVTAEAPHHDAARGARRLSVWLTEDGAVDVGRLSPRVRADLSRAVSGAEARSALGIDGSGPAPAPMPFDATICGVLYDALSSIRMAIGRTRGLSDEAALMLRYTAEEKTMLAPLTMDVLNEKFGSMAARKDLMLLASLGMLETSKWTEAMRVQEQQTAAPLPFDRSSAAVS
jgi:hypothetical protein